MIEVAGLQKRFGPNPVLRDFTFTAGSGRITLLVGPNGSGKTTALRILAGVLRADGGSIRIGDADPVAGKAPPARGQIAYLPQALLFQPRLTCRQHVRFHARLRHQTRDRAEAMLIKSGLDEHAGTPAGLLSGGLRQRLGLAILFLPDAPVLLLDEPGLSLDPEWRSRLQGYLRDEAARGKTVLVTTHLIHEWEGVADRCLLCSGGRVVGETDPARIRLPGEEFHSLPRENAL